jgi:hypothetical protein
MNVDGQPRGCFAYGATRFRSVAIWTVALLVAVSGYGQSSSVSGRVAAAPTPLVASNSMFKTQVDTLGDRFKKPGKERATLTGQFADYTGDKVAAEIIHQYPNAIHARGVERTPTIFDGQRIARSPSKMENAVLESFLTDTIEALLNAERSGKAIRFLGADFKSADETPDNPQPHYDIYQVSIPPWLTGETKTKQFWFDTTSHLLMRTTYKDGSTRIETRFSDWAMVDGARYPRRVERYEDDRLIFSFTATGISASPWKDPSSTFP